jgi:hypothetical protein
MRVADGQPSLCWRLLQCVGLTVALVLAGGAASYADSIGAPKGASTDVITRYNSKNQAEAQAKYTYVNVVNQSTPKVGYYNTASGWVRDKKPTDGQQIYGTHTARYEIMKTYFYPGGIKRDIATWVSSGKVETVRTSKDSQVTARADVFHFKTLPRGLTGRWDSTLSVCVDVKWAPDACAQKPATITFKGIWRTM